MTLKEATCVITGAARGIGAALCQVLTDRGANVVLVDQDAKALDTALGALPSRQALAVTADVSNPGDLERVASEALARWPGLDVWINNAGLARHKPIVDYTEEDLDLMLDVNLKGAVLGCQVAMRHMITQKRGHIINLISTASLRGIPNESFYCATKWGLRGFTQALQEEAAPHGIRVTAVLPGGVDTAFWDAAVDREMPVQDFLSPEQVARAIVSVLEQEETSVVRELVLRHIRDRDFSHGED